MGDFFSFTIQSGIILACLYLPYRLLLAREKQHRMNRFILLGMYLLAIAMPLSRSISFGHQEVAATLTHTVANITVGPLTGGPVETAPPLWTRILLWIYVIGVVFTLARFIWAYARLSMIIRRGRKIERDGYTLVITGHESDAPFSWRRYVVVGDERDAQECNAVMIHELRHLSAGHSADLLLGQLYAIAVWYNPVSWLMIEELKTIHEYQADQAVIDSGVNLREYQMLLIKKTVGARLPSLANSLNHNKLKKRITMMYQSKSNAAAKLSGLVLVPALAIGMAVVSIPAVASLISDTSEATLADSPRKVTKNSANAEKVQAEPFAVNGTFTPLDEVYVVAPSPTHANAPEPEAAPVAELPVKESEDKKDLPWEDTEEVYLSVEKQAQFPGEMAGLMQWLANNIRYPEDAHHADVQGRVIVRFVVMPDGSVTDAQVIKSVYPSLDQEALRVIMAMPKWQPAENGGKKVASYFHLPITFKLTPSEPKDSCVNVDSHK